VVPKINMASGQEGGGNLIESLLGILMGTKVGELAGVTPSAPRHPVAERLRNEMKDKAMGPGGPAI